MKMIIFSLFANIFCIAAEPCLKPLWEEDSHFCYYRTLCIESNVSSIGSMVKEARNNPENILYILDRIDLELEICKYNLGIHSNEIHL